MYSVSQGICGKIRILILAWLPALSTAMYSEYFCEHEEKFS